ncbi:mutator type transposase [Tanacetum coccineum]
MLLIYEVTRPGPLFCCDPIWGCYNVYGEEDPESTTRIFRRIYVCFGALKEVFKAGGRELLGLDGAFMKGQYPGQLITAVSIDANNRIYPVAYGIVESESKDSWIWFLNSLGDDLELYRNSNFTFITDRQKGFLPAIKTLFPVAEHSNCVRYIHQNMSLTWREGMYKELLWKATIATTIVEFNKSDGPLTPSVPKVFKKIKVSFAKYIVDWNGDELIQVKGPYGYQCVVNLQQRVCSCRKWEVSGLPCKHAVAAIHNMAENGMNVGSQRFGYIPLIGLIPGNNNTPSRSTQ